MKSLSIKHAPIIFAIIIVGAASFLLGLFWQTLYANFGKIPDNSFTCFSLNNLTGSYQTSCFLPLSFQQSFHFHRNLSCQAFTSQVFDESIWGKGDPVRKMITLSKSEYITFTINFQGNTLDRSPEAGEEKAEPYTIIKDTHDIIQAIRPVKQEDLDKATSYDFITLSKRTGKGMEIWHNTSEPYSIGSYFFQCK